MEQKRRVYTIRQAGKLKLFFGDNDYAATVQKGYVVYDFEFKRVVAITESKGNANYIAYGDRRGEKFARN